MDYRVVGVHGNKGGVGKSMVAANLALELADRGVRVGLLDTDLDSPYLAEMTGITDKVGLDEDRLMVPVEYNGIPVMSFAAWTPQEYAGTSMPGEMHETWVRDVLHHSDWGGVDLLVVDFPAGTRDEYLTLRRVAGDDLVGLVAVALPNVTSGLARVYNMASVNEVRILGVIENMAGEVFGQGDVEDYCMAKGLNFYGSVPLDKRIRKRHQKGEPRLPEDLLDPIRVAATHVQAEAFPDQGGSA